MDSADINNSQTGRKKVFSDKDLVHLTKKFRILSEPSRLRILRALFKGEKCVSDIVKETGLLQANVSKQLKNLVSNDIIACRPDGLQRYYRVVDDTVVQICNSLCMDNAKPYKK